MCDVVRFCQPRSLLLPFYPCMTAPCVLSLQEAMCHHPYQPDVVTGVVVRVQGTVVCVLGGPSSSVRDGRWVSTFRLRDPVSVSGFDTILCCDVPALVGLFVHWAAGGCGPLPALYATTPMWRETEIALAHIITATAYRVCAPLSAKGLLALRKPVEKSAHSLALTALPPLSALDSFLTTLTKVRYDERLCWCGSNGPGASGVCVSPSCTLLVVPFPTGLAVGSAGFLLHTPVSRIAFLGPASSVTGRHPRELAVDALRGVDTLLVLGAAPPPDLPPPPPADAITAAYARIGTIAPLMCLHCECV